MNADAKQNLTGEDLPDRKDIPVRQAALDILQKAPGDLMNPNEHAFCRAELVIPHTLPTGRPNITHIVIKADSLEKLTAKMTRAKNTAFQQGKGIHVNCGARFVFNPENKKYEPVDAIMAATRMAIINAGRFIRSLTYGA